MWPQVGHSVLTVGKKLVLIYVWPMFFFSSFLCPPPPIFFFIFFLFICSYFLKQLDVWTFYIHILTEVFHGCFAIFRKFIEKSLVPSFRRIASKSISHAAIWFFVELFLPFIIAPMHKSDLPDFFYVPKYDVTTVLE